jgi:hypothetical protein
MKEQLISFETAVLAKEKGFKDFTTSFCYHKDKETWCNTIDVIKSKRVFAPTQSVLQKWLFEVYKINCELTFDDGCWLGYTGEFSYPDSSVELKVSLECENFNDAINKKGIANEKLLQEALKLIKDETN